MCVGSPVLSCVCFCSEYLEELVDNAIAALLSGFGSFGFKPFQRCCQSNIRETAFTSGCSFACSLIAPAAVPNILCKLYITLKIYHMTKQDKVRCSNSFALFLQRNTFLNYTVKTLLADQS